MIETTQQEFENCIKDLINRKMTKVELAKKPKNDICNQELVEELEENSKGDEK